ncbi:hypothetical protein [Flavobacterium gelatinilyticum]|nr:hypothetical protein [Flavobacterium gelatinilyticum]
MKQNEKNTCRLVFFSFQNYNTSAGGLQKMPQNRDYWLSNTYTGS